MGNSQSKTQKSRREIPPLLRTHGLYKEYKWNPEQIYHAVQRKEITPLYEGSEEEKQGFVFCETCYLYYPFINKTSCCSHCICSECLAALIDFHPANRKCPFCRAKLTSVIANVDINNITDHTADEEAFQKIEAQKRAGTYVEEPLPNSQPLPTPPPLPENITQEQLSNIIQITKLPEYEVRSLLAAGIDPDLIIAQSYADNE